MLPGPWHIGRHRFGGGPSPQHPVQAQGQPGSLYGFPKTTTVFYTLTGL